MHITDEYSCFVLDLWFVTIDLQYTKCSHLLSGSLMSPRDEICWPINRKYLFSYRFFETKFVYKQIFCTLETWPNFKIELCTTSSIVTSRSALDWFYLHWNFPYICLHMLGSDAKSDSLNRYLGCTCPLSCVWPWLAIFWFTYFNTCVCG